MKKKTLVTDKDREPDSPQPPSFLEITSAGRVTVVAPERKESRFRFGGIVFLHATGSRQIRATARDLSLHGIGIRIPKKLKSYRIGSRMELEFAYPHELSGLLIEVELRRVQEVTDGFNDFGFEIVSQSRLVAMRLSGLITSFEIADIWKTGC